MLQRVLITKNTFIGGFITKRPTQGFIIKKTPAETRRLIKKTPTYKKNAHETSKAQITAHTHHSTTIHRFLDLPAPLHISQKTKQPVGQPT